MYRDNSLMPKEAVRLTVLGTLILGGTLRYGDLAAEVRHFTGRIVGPSLDLMGTSLEMLRYEGLIEAIDGSGMEDNALLGVTATRHCAAQSGRRQRHGKELRGLGEGRERGPRRELEIPVCQEYLFGPVDEWVQGNAVL